MITGPVLDPPTLLFPGAGAPAADPVRPAPAESALNRVDERIVAVLRGAVEGLRGVAAELRLVDDLATEVRTSHHHAADPAFVPTPPEPLATAASELAAMSGSAVVLGSEAVLKEWDIAQPVGSAICVPVASDTTIHGALWVYAAEACDADRPTVQLAELLGGRLAVEIERGWLLDAESRRSAALPVTPGRRSAAGARRTGRRRAPAARPNGTPFGGAPLVETPLVETPFLDAPSVETPPAGETEATSLAGMTIASAEGARALHAERRLSDGRLLMAAGAVLDTPGLSPHEAAHVRRTVADAIDRLADDSRDAGELLTRVGRELWRSTTGGDAVSMAVALVDEETGEATIALAGDAAALRVQAARRTPLATDLPPIGWEPCEEEDGPGYPATQLELAVRERLVLAIGGSRQTGEETADQMASGFKPATADDHRRMTARQTLARASAAPAVSGSPLLAASVLRRG